MLKENHDNNSKLFLMISASPTPKLSPLEEFELGLRSQIEQFKAKRYGWTYNWEGFPYEADKPEFNEDWSGF